MERGTTLDDPVTAERKPNLQGANHQINEYLQDQCAYDLFSYLLKDLLKRQPADPLDHMLKCLKTDYPLGPLKVILSSPPSVGRARHAQRLAKHFGLEYIGAGELLREAGVETAGVGYADERATAELVMQRVEEAIADMRGFVLDGFPRTRYQTSFLKDRSVVPTHVLVLEATSEQVRQRQQLIGEGRLDLAEGESPVSEEVMEQKLRLHSCHSSSALEVYQAQMSIVKVQQGSEGQEAMWQQLEACVRLLPRSRGPHPPPRVVLLGPRGIGSKEHASRLAGRLGAVFVDGADYPVDEATGLPTPRTEQKQKPMERLLCKRQSEPMLATANLPVLDGSRPSTGHYYQHSTPKGPVKRSVTSLDMERAVQERSKDQLGALGCRLRDPDCTKQGWVVCGFPLTEKHAEALREDSRLAPTRVVALRASVETCVRRLRSILTDAATGKVWTSLPKNETVRKRLMRKPEDHPTAVREAHAKYSEAVEGILDALSTGGQCTQLDAEGPPEAVHGSIVEFVERPLPLPPHD